MEFVCALFFAIGPSRLFNAAIGFLLLSGMTQVNLLLRGNRKIVPVIYIGFVGFTAAYYMRYRVS
jgi:hypothetical protein